MAAVRYRGLDSRTGLARWGLAAVAVGIVAGATAPDAVRGLVGVLSADGQGLSWLFVRLFAFLAYFAVAGSVIYGLLLSTKLLDAIAHRPVNFTLHQDLAAIGLGLAGIHAVLLGLDHAYPFSIVQMLVPGLAPHAPLAVAVGQVTLYLMAIVIASFYVRRHIGQRAWRTLHYVTFLAFAGATGHGIMAGSDSGSGWAQMVYLVPAVAVAFLLTYRIVLSVMERATARIEQAVAERLAVAGRPIVGGRPITRLEPPVRERRTA